MRNLSILTGFFILLAFVISPSCKNDGQKIGDNSNSALIQGMQVNVRGVPQYKEIMTGGTKMITVDGKYLVWTKKVGNGDIKVLLLHGGPGFSHDAYGKI